MTTCCSLFAAALSIPTKSDLMQYAVLHVEDQAKKDRVAKLIPSMAWIADAPVFLVFAATGDASAVCELRGTDFAHEEIDSFFNPTVDAALAMSAFIRAAEGEGLVTCPISAVREPVTEISRCWNYRNMYFRSPGFVSAIRIGNLG